MISPTSHTYEESPLSGARPRGAVRQRIVTHHLPSMRSSRISNSRMVRTTSRVRSPRATRTPVVPMMVMMVALVTCVLPVRCGTLCAVGTS